MLQLNIFSATVAVLISYPIVQAIYNAFFHPLSRFRGPLSWSASRIPFIGGLLRGTLVWDLNKIHQAYGPIVRIAPDEITFAHPDAWVDILQPRPGQQQFLKDPLWWSEPNAKSLINAIDPVAHARIRRTLVPAFTKSALKAQEPIVLQYVHLLVERLRERLLADRSADGKKEGNTVDIFPWLNFTTFDIFGDLGFGESFGCLDNSRYHPWIALIFNSIKILAFVNGTKFFPMVDWLLKQCIPPSMKRKQDDHFQQVVNKVQRRMNWEVAREDIMSHTLKEAKQGKGMTVDEINYTFAGLTVAASETTATVLGGILNHLSQNARSRRAVMEEVRSKFSHEGEISLDRAEECEYMTGVIHEGLRLCPPVPWVLPRRVPPGGSSVCGEWLPAGTRVSITQFTLNRDPSLFHDACAFMPERWLADASTDPSSPFFSDCRSAIQPFSVGPRGCLGKHLAWAELRLVLAHLLWAFDIDEKDGGALQWEALRTFLLVEKRPIELKLRARSQ